MKYFIAIAGNIGAGKSSLARKLAEHFHWQLCKEPFQINPYLENFYKDMSKWAFHCEISFLAHRLENHLQVLNKDYSVIQDRCVYEGAEVFVKNLQQNFHLNDTDWETYNHLYKTTCSLLKPPDLIIYIESSTERCINNIKKRERGLEWDLSEKYISDLNRLYRDWVENFTLCPILKADANDNDYKYNENDLKTLIEQINKKLKIAKLPL